MGKGEPLWSLSGVWWQRMIRMFPAFSLLLATLASAQDRVVAYVPNWIDLPAFAETIDYAKVTHLNIAFENPTNDRGDLSFNRGDKALLAKAHAHNIPVLVSIGGGSASSDSTLLKRYAGLLGRAKRAAFIGKLVDYVISRGFDGLDVDLEGPAIGPDYGAFIAELAPALKAKGKLLTAALSQGYGGDKVPDSVFAQFDFVNVMAYDATGPWDRKSPGQHSSMEFAQDNVEYWIGRGLPKEKAVLGVPFYGYGFGRAFRKDEYPYQEIVTLFPGAEKADQAGQTVWYNGLATIKAKTAWVKAQGLGGVMIWSLDSDAKDGRSLLAAIAETLHPR
jgi:GH18 family chitinase